jgi:hypothetical protein
MRLQRKLSLGDLNAQYTFGSFGGCPRRLGTSLQLPNLRRTVLSHKLLKGHTH